MRRRIMLVVTSIVLVVVVAALGVFIAMRVYAGPSSLTGRAWTLTSLVVDGRQQSVSQGQPATLRFQAGDHTVSGTGGCNTYGASYTVFGGSLRFGEMRSTLIACLDMAIMEQESAYLQALDEVDSYQLGGDTLTLNGAAGRTVITFRPEGGAPGTARVGDCSGCCESARIARYGTIGGLTLSREHAYTL